MEHKKMQVHVVSVLYNSAPTLEIFVQGVAAQGASIGAVTLIDNGSTDGSAERARVLLKSLPIPSRVIEQANRGFAGGYARAVQPDDGLSVLCVNPDVRLAEGAVDDMLQVIDADPRAAIVTTPLLDLDGGLDSATRRRLPRLGGSALYAVLGGRTPARWRYNSREDSPVSSVAGLPVSIVEATTGALMLVRREFRTIATPVFDTDYWMYGEDLQLCADAASSGYHVLVVERDPSLHVKGASSGRPRSLRSNVAFHAAMWTYASKNMLSRPSPARLLVRSAIFGRLILDEARNAPTKVRRRLAMRRGDRTVALVSTL